MLTSPTNGDATVLFSGWIRCCLACGDPDIHAVYPDPAMFDRSPWRCGTCGAGVHTAVRVSDVCPALGALA